MRPICSQESCPLDWRVTLADGPLHRVRRAGRMGLVKGMAVSRGPRACQAQSPWRGGALQFTYFNSPTGLRAILC